VPISIQEIILLSLLVFIIVAVLAGGVYLMLTMMRRNREIMTPHVNPPGPHGHR
jgi:hypothetical protein